MTPIRLFQEQKRAQSYERIGNFITYPMYAQMFRWAGYHYVEMTRHNVSDPDMFNRYNTDTLKAYMDRLGIDYNDWVRLGEEDIWFTNEEDALMFKLSLL